MVIYDDIDPVFTAIESELEYNNYLAQKVFFDELAVLSIKFSETTYILEADIKQTVMNYIRKVVSNIQLAWNKFKSAITKTVWNTVKKKYAAELKMDRTFEITEATSNNDVFVEWDNIDSFMKNNNGVIQIDLNNEEDINEIEIFKKFAPGKFDTMKLDKLSVGGVIGFINDNLNLFTKMKPGMEITLDIVNEYSNRLDNIGNDLKNIETFLKSFNNMEKNIENEVRNAENRVAAPTNNGTNVNTSESVITSSNIYNILLNENTNYISEAIKGVDQQDPEGVEAKSGKQANTNIYKKTSKICKAYTVYLSVMMNIISKANNKSISVILTYVRNAAKYRKKENNEGKTVETPTTNTNDGSQVNI